MSRKEPFFIPESPDDSRKRETGKLAGKRGEGFVETEDGEEEQLRKDIEGLEKKLGKKKEWPLKREDESIIDYLRRVKGWLEEKILFKA